MNPIILVPARMAATRLPGKPLADIAGKPMIVRVAERAAAADVGRVIVATDSPEIASVAKEAGFESVMTDARHRSGSDRVFEALHHVDPDGKHDTVINVQGDLPTIDPRSIRAATRPLEDPAVDMATLAALITDEYERTNPDVVKVVGTMLGHDRMRAIYFTRSQAPWGEGPLYHHIGLYGFRRKALERFVGLPQSDLEIRERLEQLRAIENGMRVDVQVVADVPLGVDSAADLERARELCGRLSAG